MQFINAAQGALVGLACGDAVGTTLEFRRRGSFIPIDDMQGGGPFNLAPGQWTDDTSMALCLALSLVNKGGFDPVDQMNRYCNWYHHGYMSSTGVCFDIGNTVARALNTYLKTQDPYSGSADPQSSGNGSLMRLAPIAIYYAHTPEDLIKYAGLSSKTTHASAECIDSCRYFACLLAAALKGAAKEDLLRSVYQPQTPKVADLARGEFLEKPYTELTGSGYVIDSLESALWCFFKAETFRDAVLLAANIGNDADTTAAICGQIAGAYYGYEAIDPLWRQRLHDEAMIRALATELAEQAPS